MNKLVDELNQQLAEINGKAAVVSIHHLADLDSELNNNIKQGILRSDSYHRLVSFYNLTFNFKPPVDFPAAQSIIITAALQPKVEVKFKSFDKIYRAIIPPTYMDSTDKEVMERLSSCLAKFNYQLHPLRLPLKLLAMHSGLASYGRNNITYTDQWGSFFRLKGFYSDLPCQEDTWQEVRMMEFCHKCVVCLNQCPTGAISRESFLIKAEKCLTFFNEGSDNFPEWIKLPWHNCLIGCIKCQDVCPVNKEYKKFIVSGSDFSEEETSMILQGVAKDQLPLDTIEKLKKICLLDDYQVLQRNLAVLIRKNKFLEV